MTNRKPTRRVSQAHRDSKIVLFAAVSACVYSVGLQSHAQTTYSWLTSGAGTAWATTSNWTNAAYAGSTTSTNNDVALVTTAATGTQWQMNMGTLGSPFYLGGIVYTGSGSVAKTMGANTSTAGVITFNGFTLGGNTTLVSNQTSSGSTLTFAALATGGSGTGLSYQFNASGFFDVQNTFSNIIFSAPLAETSGGAKSITKIGLGTLELQTTNNFTGAVNINSGVLTAGTINNGGQISSVGTTSTINVGTSSSAASFFYSGAATASTDRSFVLGNLPSGSQTIGVNSSSGKLTLTSAIDGSNAVRLQKSGSGTLVLGNTGNTFNGVTISSGTLEISDAAQLGTAGGGITLGGGALLLNGTISVPSSRTVSLAAIGTIATGASGTPVATISAPVSGSTNVLNIIGNTGTVVLAGSGSTFGTLQVQAGAFRLGADEVIPNSSSVNLAASNSIWDINGKTETVNTIGGTPTAGAIINVNGGTLNVLSSGLTYAVFQGAGAINYLSSGSGSTWSYYAQSSFSGRVNVGAPFASGSVSSLGAFQLNVLNASQYGALSSSSASVNINNAALFELRQTSTANVAGRINSSIPFTLNNGRFLYSTYRATTAGTTSTESFGTFTGVGLTTFTFDVFTGSSGNVTGAGVTLAGLTLNDLGGFYLRSTTANSTVVGGNVAAQNRFTLKVGSGLTGITVGSGTGTQQAILPWLGGGYTAASPSAGSASSVTSMNAFAFYDTNGIRLVAANDATYFAQISGGGAVLTDNANNNLSLAFGNVPADITGTKVINSLSSTSTSQSPTFNGAGTLRIYSGLLGSNTAMTFNGPTVEFGDLSTPATTDDYTGYIFLASSQMTFSGTSSISGKGGVSVNALDTGGILSLVASASSSFSGGLAINGNASVQIASDGHLGAPTSGIILGGGNLSYQPTVDNSAMTIASTRSLKVNAANGTLTVGRTSFTNTTVSFSGTLTGTGQLNKAGPGTLVLTPSSTSGFNGPINLVAGTLFIGGTYAGPISSPSTTANTSTFSPASSSSVVGQVTASAFTLASGTTYQADIGGPTAGTSYDQTVVSTGGTVTLGGATLVIASLNSFALNSSNFVRFTIIDNQGSQPVSGIFASLAEGATITVATQVGKISYVGGDGNDVVITVPEPTSFLLLGSATMLLARRRRGLVGR